MPDLRRLAVGIDLGGSQIKAGVVDDRGRLLHLARVPTPAAAASPGEVIEQIRVAAELVRGQLPAGAPPPEGVGVTTPAFSLGRDWVQLLSSNIPSLEGFPLRPALQDLFGPAVVWEYDTNAAMLAEMRFGRAAAYQRVLYAGVGTGVSFAVAVGRRLVDHSFGTTGNSGHVIVEPDGADQCTCGGRGCLEALLSGWALRAAALEAARSGKSPRLAARLEDAGDLAALDLAEAAREGDQQAVAVFERAAAGLGVALATLVHLYLPEAIFLGGGLAGAADLLWEGVRDSLRRLASPACLKGLKTLEVGVIGPEAGVIGVASSVLYGSGHDEPL